MIRKLSSSLRGIIIYIVLLLTGFSLAIIVHQAISDFENDIEQTKRLAGKLASQIASEVNLLVGIVRFQGKTFSLLPDVQKQNADSMNVLLADFRSNNPIFANVVLLDQKGDVWASGIPLGGKHVSLADRNFFKEVMKTGEFVVGEFVVGKTSGKPSLNFGYPIKNAIGKTVGCVAIALDLTYFKHHFEKAELPAKASFVIIDHQGIVLFRYLDPEKYIGTKFPVSEIQTMLDGPEEYVDVGAALDGILRIRASVKLSKSPGEAPYLFIRVGIPYDTPKISAIKRLMSKVLFQLTALFFVLTVLWYIGRHFILRPVEILREAFIKVGQGDFSIRLTGVIKVEELAAMAPDFDKMVSDLSANITKLKNAEADLLRSGEWHHQLIETSMDGFWGVGSEGKINEVNETYCKMSGYNKSELLSLKVMNLEALECPEEIAARVKKIFAGGDDRFESAHRRKDGTIFPVEVSIQYRKIRDGRLAVFIRDISGRKKGEEENRKLQEQLAQAQKMEVVGRLAGGVAHDFNNMLSIILGYTELIKDECKEEEQLNGLLAIEKAALHSRDIARQLLAFSRKQLITPKVLDINHVISDAQKMVSRLMGEDILLELNLAPHIGPVMLDPAQIDQIILNLAANARDAMTNGGRMIFTTKNFQGDSTFFMEHPEITPGKYVLLQAEDSGMGIDAGTMKHIFEPFFTTKEVGKGTGLGLATVYGIVKQNNGHILVSSELGKGTIFSIYFPQHIDEQATIFIEKKFNPTLFGQGTILVVEDEQPLRKLIVTMLEKIGYTVLTSSSTEEAIEIFSREKNQIDLLVSDVVMPGINGIDLQKILLSKKPALKTLFISGFPVEVMASKGLTDATIPFLLKPFTMASLAEKIKEILK